ncbi:CaiB/BaiF CoA-transferase family protein [Sphingomonas sp. AR_OL41]|uniref:CaiB/BaiF CoA transferase family protein n=1 Tax=Sphingomonas sp. AR_OL41 TaxID=3042729 RepID=UPI0024800B2A|nr:CaiB/BaiF CoA-transferase family protein [Sphingomonas sp. AR_OL41]MDH7974305.1 CaiB/BaiF CoA-transferase family protein [Sphingomonas sp. AR_OL41]
MSGPLAGLRVIEFAGLGPTPFGAMMLADMGAEVLRVDRHRTEIFGGGDERDDFLNRSRPSLALDLKSGEGRALALELASRADILIEGFRPGVMERLGLGPEPLIAANPRLIYARMTGWGQSGPMTHKAGHDINYLSMTGGLSLIGPFDGPPVPPINYVANFGGGGMLMVVGVLGALVERSVSGRGQVVDAAMVDGASLLATQIFAWTAMGRWHPGRGGNLLDGSAYFYRCYRTADDKFVAVGALEPQFHAELIRGVGLDPATFGDHLDPACWAQRAAQLEAIFATRDRDAWIEHFASFDACLSPVLTPEEATRHPANVARGVHVAVAGAMQPAPAPRFDRTPSPLPTAPVRSGEGGEERLRAWGIEPAAVAL